MSREWNTEAWSSLSGILEDKKADDVIAYSGPNSKLRKVTVHERIKEERSIRDCGVHIGVYGSERRDPRGQRGME